MGTKEFIQNFADQFDDVNVPKLSFETRFRDVEGWSSIKALMIIAMVDEVYKVTLDGEDMLNSETIDDIYNIIIARK